MKYEKEFREAMPETIGEKDGHFDAVNYYEWLEKNSILTPNIGKLKEVIQDVLYSTGILETWKCEDIADAIITEIIKENVHSKES